MAVIVRQGRGDRSPAAALVSGRTDIAPTFLAAVRSDPAPASCELAVLRKTGQFAAHIATWCAATIASRVRPLPRH